MRPLLVVFPARAFLLTTAVIGAVLLRRRIGKLQDDFDGLFEDDAPPSDEASLN